MDHPPDPAHEARKAVIDRIRTAWHACPDTRELNAAQFADRLGIPRSTFNAKIRAIRPNGAGRHARDFTWDELVDIADATYLDDRRWLFTGLGKPPTPWNNP